MAFEREIFINLMWTPECRSLRHLFTAERAASKIPDVPEDTPKREIGAVAVIGAGTMGGGIAMNFLNAGIPVKMLEMKQEALDRGIATIARTTKPRSRRASSSRTSGPAHGLLSTTLSYDDLGRRPGDRSRVRGHRRQGSRVQGARRVPSPAPSWPPTPPRWMSTRSPTSPSARRTWSACTSSARPT
jgi:hypothetical protein